MSDCFDVYGPARNEPPPTQLPPENLLQTAKIAALEAEVKELKRKSIHAKKYWDAMAEVERLNLDLKMGQERIDRRDAANASLSSALDTARREVERLKDEWQVQYGNIAALQSDLSDARRERDEAEAAVSRYEDTINERDRRLAEVEGLLRDLRATESRWAQEAADSYLAAHLNPTPEGAGDARST